jgi:UDP-N-acetylmuramate: L-alanyl-gamma-D-glutamyl-meso-diaminopimelate ligase
MRELWNTQMWPLFLFPRCGKIKQLEEVSYDQIAQAFNQRLNYLYKSKDFKDYLFNLNLDNSALLLMSSGNYGGLNFDEVKGLVQ